MYEKVIADLRRAYDGQATERDASPIEPWKADVRERFLRRLREEGLSRLLEIGAGPGRDSLFFQQSGLEVTCTDLSPEMVRLAREKGLDAHVMDFLSLDFPDGSFDAIFALNCLLHVPTDALPAVLAELRRLLRPGGLFCLTLYGGEERAGPWPEDHHDPPRYFVYHTDEKMRALVEPFFDLVHFERLEQEEGTPFHVQSMIWRRPAS